MEKLVKQIPPHCNPFLTPTLLGVPSTHTVATSTEWPAFTPPPSFYFPLSLTSLSSDSLWFLFSSFYSNFLLLSLFFSHLLPLSSYCIRVYHINFCLPPNTTTTLSVPLSFSPFVCWFVPSPPPPPPGLTTTYVMCLVHVCAGVSHGTWTWWCWCQCLPWYSSALPAYVCLL